MSQLEMVTNQTADILGELESLMAKADTLGGFDIAGKMKLASQAQEKARELAALQLAFMREVTAQLQHLEGASQ
ncbi:MAG: hypothetical protein WED11_04910 [Natronospirillum sp.]